MDYRLYTNKQILIEKDKVLALNKLELEKLQAQHIQDKKYRMAKDLQLMSKNKVAIKKLEIRNFELDVKYFKETYLSV